MTNNEFRYAGAFCPTNTVGGFCIPVFEFNNELFTPESCCGDVISNFNNYHGTEQIISGDNIFTKKLGDLMTYAYMFPNKTIEVGDRNKIEATLRRRFDELLKYPFLKVEVIEFVEDYDKLPGYVIEAASLIMIDNPKGAKYWAESQARQNISHVTWREEIHPWRYKTKLIKNNAVQRLIAAFSSFSTETLNDKDFYKCYYVKDNHIKNSNTKFIVGKKGSGKSSLIRHLLNSDQDKRSITFESDILTTVVKAIQLISPQETVNYDYRLFWKAAFGTHMLQQIDNDNCTNITNAITSKSLALNTRTTIPDKLRFLFIDIQRKHPAVANAFIAFFSNTYSNNLYLVDNIYTELASSLRKQSNEISCLIDSKLTSSVLYSSDFSAIFDLVSDVNALKLPINIQVALDNESYSKVIKSSRDYFKCIESTYLLKWLPSDLLNVINLRSHLAFNEGNNEYSSRHNDIIFNDRFETIFPSVRFHNTHTVENGLSYILRHTPRTPRHLFYAISMILQEAETDLTCGNRISEYHLRKGVSKAVHLFVKDALSTEDGKQEAYYETFAEVLPALKSLFSLRDLEKAWKKSFGARKQFNSPESMLRILIAINAVGTVVTKEGEIVHSDYDNSLFPGELDLDVDNQYCMHPAFEKVFGKKSNMEMTPQLIIDHSF